MAALSTTGSTQARFPFFFDSQKELTSGIWAPQAGLGHLTVRAQSQAITVALPPPCSLGFREFPATLEVTSKPKRRAAALPGAAPARPAGPAASSAGR